MLELEKEIEKEITKEDVEKTVDERDIKCTPVAKEILQLIAKHDPEPKVIQDKEEYFERYGPIYADVAKVFSEHDLTIAEINYTWSIVQAVFDQVKDISNRTLQNGFRVAEEKLFGVKDGIDSLTFNKLNDILKS